jgi:hypothetical protein
MMRKALVLTSVVLGLMLVSFNSASAFSISVDGLLDEWGVNPDTYSNSQWTPNSGILSFVEDTSPSTNTVGPGIGGQPFDVEAMYLTTDTSNLYFAVVTGFPPDGASNYVAGDIGFDFGINGSYDYGISTLDRNGFLTGRLYNSTGWANGFWMGSDPLSGPTYMTAGTLVPGSNGSLIYTEGTYNGDHYIIEGYMPLLAFGSDWGNDFRMHWAMSCGNDYVYIDYSRMHTPEPATMALLGLGLLGLAGLRRRKLSSN